MKVRVDKDKCIGCGTCVAIAPKSFKFTDDGKVEFVGASTPSTALGTSSLGASDDAKIKEAIDSCPVAAIESTE